MHPAYMRDLVGRIRSRRDARYKLDPKIQGDIDIFELEYPEYDLPWLWLSLAVNNPENESESLLDRLAVDPWDSKDQEVSAIWEYLSSPSNLNNLMKRLENGSMNTHAKRLLDKAISDATGRV